MKITCSKNILIRTFETESAEADIWFIHGFGDSGLSFIEVFNSCLTKNYNIYVPDLPGFGVSPFNREASKLSDAADFFKDIIQSISGNRPLVLVAHSMGSIIGTLICKLMEIQIKLFVSIEGFLIADQIRYSSQVEKYPSVEDFHTYILNTVLANANGNKAILRYYSSLIFANPNALKNWAKSCYLIASSDKMGIEYTKLNCKTLYLWGTQSLQSEQLNFIQRNEMQNHPFETGHWPMIDSPHLFYEYILKSLNTN